MIRKVSEGGAEGAEAICEDQAEVVDLKQPRGRRRTVVDET